MIKPWQNPLNKAPSQGGKEGRERERETKSEPEEQHCEYKCHAYSNNLLN